MDTNLPEIPVIDFDVDLAFEIAQLIFDGLTLSDCKAYLSISDEMMRFIVNDIRYQRVVLYARAKAKHALLGSQMAIAMDVTHRESAKSGQFLLSSRWSILPERAELRQRAKEHKENMQLKRESARTWADVQTAKLIQSASGQQLQEYQQLAVDTEIVPK